MPKSRVIYWFRTDLRLHDSPALKAALDLDAECLYPIWTWDPHYVYRARVGPNRWSVTPTYELFVRNALTLYDNIVGSTSSTVKMTCPSPSLN